MEKLAVSSTIKLIRGGHEISNKTPKCAQKITSLYFKIREHRLAVKLPMKKLVINLSKVILSNYLRNKKVFN